MQAKVSDRAKATLLRKQGLSYSEIQKTVLVSKASLSLWLRSVALNRKQKDRLKTLALRGQKAAAQARHLQRLTRLEEVRKNVTHELPELLANSFFLLGLVLYWAEGSKQKPWNLKQIASFSNSDPNLILLMRRWFIECCYIPRDRFTYRMHIHDSANIENSRKKWARILGVPAGKISITLKHHEVRSRHKHDHYIGLIQMGVLRSTWLNRRIELWTKGVAEKFLAGSV